MTRALASALALAATAVLAAGCGSDSGSSASGGAAYGGGTPAKTTTAAKTTTSAAAATGAGLVRLGADESGGLSFKPKALTAKAGSVTFKMTNPSNNGLPHAVAITGGGVDRSGPVVQPGGTSTLTVTLKPGKYTFYCPVDSHQAAGMEGQVTVS